MVNNGLLRRLCVTHATENVCISKRCGLFCRNEMVRAGPRGRPMFRAFLVRLVIFVSLCQTSEGKNNPSKRERFYTNGWAVKVIGGLAKAQIVARQHGFEKVEKVW